MGDRGQGGVRGEPLDHEHDGILAASSEETNSLDRPKTFALHKLKGARSKSRAFRGAGT
jgi:hypothetical protein